jgi:hypothetical protein
MQKVLTWARIIEECKHNGSLRLDDRHISWCRRCGAQSVDGVAWRRPASVASLLVAVDEARVAGELDALVDEAIELGELAPEVARLLDVCRCGHDRGEHLGDEQAACEFVGSYTIDVIGGPYRKAPRTVVDPCECHGFELAPKRRSMTREENAAAHEALMPAEGTAERKLVDGFGLTWVPNGPAQTHVALVGLGRALGDAMAPDAKKGDAR